jgi:predicted P-loop ATPase
VAREKPFHPVRDFLKSLSWDEVVRLDLWLTAYFQVEETEYTKAVAARWLIAAVARVFEPGCRADQVLVLHGEQGLEKSSGLHALFGDEWFADHLSALGSKDARQELQGKWGIELGELLPTHRAENGLVKNFISTRVDHFRPSYGWRAQDFPRQCIFAATTNVDSPFTDETGNRRFWSVNCGRVDVKALAAVRDQLWAEAYARYRRGDPSWLETSELNALAEKEQRTRYEPGARDDLIEAWIQVPKRRQQEHEWDEEFPWFGSEPGKINTTDVLIHGLGIPQAQIRTPQDSREVARCLRNLGYKREQLRRGEKRGTHYFVKPASPPEIRKES